MSNDSTPITELLQRWRAGDGDAFERLMPLVYDELHRMAARQMCGEASGHTLTPTAVVHETYLRLVRQTGVEWNDRRHFFAVASTSMRRLLVEHARRRLARRRGGVPALTTLDEALTIPSISDERLLELDEALDTLTAAAPRLSQVVECRFFTGLTEEETAETLGVTARTVRRDWVKARGWLEAALRD